MTRALLIYADHLAWPLVDGALLVVGALLGALLVDRGIIVRNYGVSSVGLWFLWCCGHQSDPSGARLIVPAAAVAAAMLSGRGAG
jgi:hypothetical protein